MAYSGTDNLRCYLRASTLPKMINDPLAPQIPPRGHKSHQNHLQVRSEAWRRLEAVQGMTESAIETIVTSWVDSHIPEHSLGIDDANRLTGERLSIPCPSIFKITPHVERRPSDIIRLSSWLDNLPLMTVQRTLHILYPETRAWGFFLADQDDKDRRIFQYFLWTSPTQGSTKPEIVQQSKIGQKPMVVAFQPPWILSEQDLKEFSECRSFPPFRVPGHAFPSPLESKERLWAKIWDICVTRNTPWFVMTSYNQWVFGAFSTGWTTAFVTSVYNFDTYGPTILEWLTFWVASAMRIGGSSAVPQVPEPVHNLGPPSIPPSYDANCSIPPAAISESYWDGKSEEPGSSAGVHGIFSAAISDAGLPRLSIPADRPAPSVEKVTRWMQMDVDLAPSLSTSWSSGSTPTINTLEVNNNSYRGDWLA